MSFCKKLVKNRCKRDLNFFALSISKKIIKVRIQIGLRTRCQTNVHGSMTINRISIERMVYQLMSGKI